MSKSINVDDIAKEITKCMEIYTENVTEGIEAAIDRKSKEAVKELKTTSPVGKTPRKGHYKDGWVSVKESDRYQKSRTVWNKKHYQRVHLLEDGHLTRNGKRVKAIPHVTPVDEKVQKELLQEIEEIIENGG